MFICINYNNGANLVNGLTVAEAGQFVFRGFEIGQDLRCIHAGDRVIGVREMLSAVPPALGNLFPLGTFFLTTGVLTALQHTDIT